jgi:hypothetical protein
MTGKKMQAVLLASAFASVWPALSAAAEDGGSLSEFLALDPPHWEIGDTEIQLGGFGTGALYTSSADNGPAHSGDDRTATTGLLTTNIRLRKILDNGIVLGARADFLVYHSALAGDNYGNDAFEKLYAYVQTGFGRVEIGQQDGAVAQLALTGPIVARQVSLENRALSFFRDPVTGADFARLYPTAIDIASTSNYAKIDYASPRLLGIQVAAAFTPNTVRTPLPFTGNPASDFDKQQNLWELAASYTGYFSNVAVGLSAGFTHGSIENRTPGFGNLSDWQLGAQVAYTVSDIKLSAGGGYRETNAYLLDVEAALNHGDTRILHLSTMAERGNCLLGFEFSNAALGGPTDYRILGYQLAAGYKLNPNLQLTAGWQWYTYRRDAGAFYNGLSLIGMNAGFLTFGYAL